MNIRITVGSTVLTGEIFDTELGRKIQDLLPIETRPNRWGDEIYFSIALNTDITDEVEIVQVGDLAYWPPGSAFCIFYGPTPASADDRPRAASEVEVFGHIKDAEKLKSEKGASVRIEKA